MPTSVRSDKGFTLVELLVVIAIIGVLVALLLPAVNAAREAARRTQCLNQTRQMGLAILNHEGAVSTFPGGGAVPLPLIEDYSMGGSPFGADRQGLSWAFQILPYLEEDAVHGLTATEAIVNSPISIYFCPSRRRPTLFPKTAIPSGAPNQPYDVWLMDYAAMQPMPVPPQITQADYDNRISLRPNGFSLACLSEYAFWGTGSKGSSDFMPPPATNNGFLGYNGVMVRARGYRATGGQWMDTGTPGPARSRQIKDGLSKTAMVGEKFVRIRNYASEFSISDDRGWSDGWDYDTMKLAICAPTQDQKDGFPLNVEHLRMGSAHAAGFNCVFADGAVHFLNFQIDPVMLNRIAHRSDGQLIDLQ